MRPLASIALLALAVSARLQAQATIAPTNDLPNPYRTIAGWAVLPEGRTWGSTSAVDVDRDGKSIWVAERCGANSCAGSTLDPVLEFDATGKLVRHFGAGLLISPHAMSIDRQGNVWVADCACTGAAARPRDTTAAAPVQASDSAKKGHQVFKFS